MLNRLPYIFILVICLCDCSARIVNTRNVYETPQLSSDSVRLENNYIKVHLTNGFLAVLNSWEIDDKEQLITGSGFYYNTNREETSVNSMSMIFNYEDIVLVETNEYKGFNLISPLLMTVSTVFSSAAIPCIGNPEACFGSCPTYYLHQDNALLLQAEGFSSSITKSMEATDIDYLADFKPGYKDEIKIELVNEAMETHYIRKTELLAVERIKEEEIIHGNGRFYAVSGLSLPKSAIGSGQDLLDPLKLRDGIEYWSASDSADLTKKESLILEFDQHYGPNAAIAITQRQSLMTTFLFYQSMAYMGSKLGELIAAYERASPIVRNAQKTMYDILGGIEVSVLVNGKWKKVGTIDEQGPIASDTHLLPVKHKGEFTKIKLTMTKGLWRIDQVAVYTVIGERKPNVLRANKLINNGDEELSLLHYLNDSSKMLVNGPGTSYTLAFERPEMDNFSLFLRSQGYYTEWMRSEWLKEENTEMVQLMIKNPTKWLQQMSPRYKLAEPVLESQFWSSKMANHGF